MNFQVLTKDNRSLLESTNCLNIDLQKNFQPHPSTHLVNINKGIVVSAQVEPNIYLI